MVAVQSNCKLLAVHIVRGVTMVESLLCMLPLLFETHYCGTTLDSSTVLTVSNCKLLAVHIVSSVTKVKQFHSAMRQFKHALT